MARFGRIGWFLGLVFGTLFGVLFAPRKGKDLRAKIKADRRKGKFGISPLKDDMRLLGEELAEIAREIYQSTPVQDIVEMGRRSMKNISNDLVDEVHDFHVTRIAPLQHEARARARDGKKALGRAKKGYKSLKKKVNESAEIGKRAFGEVKRVFKKKSA